MVNLIDRLMEFINSKNEVTIQEILSAFSDVEMMKLEFALIFLKEHGLVNHSKGRRAYSTTASTKRFLKKLREVR